MPLCNLACLLLKFIGISNIITLDESFSQILYLFGYEFLFLVLNMFDESINTKVKSG